MAELFVLRAVCFGRAYGTLKWQKNKKTEDWGSFYCLVEDGEFEVEVKSYNSASRVNELPFSVLLFPARSLNSWRGRTHKLTQQNVFLFG